MLEIVSGSARRQLQVLKFRGTDFRGGLHDYSIRRGGLNIYPRLVAAEHTQSFERGRIRSGVTALDRTGRVRELSRMLAGLEDSEFGKAHAEELLALAAAERSQR